MASPFEGLTNDPEHPSAYLSDVMRVARGLSASGAVLRALDYSFEDRLPQQYPLSLHDGELAEQPTKELLLVS